MALKQNLTSDMTLPTHHTKNINTKTLRIMYKIQANASGTRSIEISEQHLQTIERYSLLKNLIDSNGIIDESVLDKLKLNVRSMLESEAGKDKDLLDLCLDVIYNSNMKAFGLHKLILLYVARSQDEGEKNEAEEDNAEEQNDK